MLPDDNNKHVSHVQMLEVKSNFRASIESSLFVNNTAERYFVITIDAVLSFLLLVFDTAAASCYSPTCVSRLFVSF